VCVLCVCVVLCVNSGAFRLKVEEEAKRAAEEAEAARLKAEEEERERSVAFKGRF